MFELLTTGLIFLSLIGGLGLPLAATAPFDPDERLCFAAVAGGLAVYLAAWVIYWCGLPPLAFGALPVTAGVALGWRRQAVWELFRAPEARRLASLWLILAGWCLGWLAMIRSYSGGEWMSDWAEHYDRARFFLEHQSLDTLFLGTYPLPARPPLANLVTGAGLALAGTGFPAFQVFLALFSTLSFLPAALLARRFRGSLRGDAAPVLAVILMLSPMFLQNTTFTWTKLPTAFFLLAGLHFLLRTGRAPDDPRTVCATGCLAAALLTHYSAAPYVIVLAAWWIWQRRGDWRQPAFWRAALRPALVTVVLLATWFAWSARHYGQATFLSNTVATSSAGLTLLQQLQLRAENFFILIVPHPLRSAGYEFVEQTSRSGWWRDYFFNLYQTNLPLAFGSGGCVVLAVLLWRQRNRIDAFWAWFISGTLLLNVATMFWNDRWGGMHIGLQPAVILGLAWIAANLPTLSRGLRAWLALGLAVDFGLGIALHYRVQHLDFPRDVFSNYLGWALRVEHGNATWINFYVKCSHNLTFVGDSGIPVGVLGTLLVVLLGLALRKAYRSRELPS